jgi:hypothetical protein
LSILFFTYNQRGFSQTHIWTSLHLLKVLHDSMLSAESSSWSLSLPALQHNPSLELCGASTLSVWVHLLALPYRSFPLVHS